MGFYVGSWIEEISKSHSAECLLSFFIHRSNEFPLGRLCLHSVLVQQDRQIPINPVTVFGGYISLGLELAGRHVHSVATQLHFFGHADFNVGVGIYSNQAKTIVETFNPNIPKHSAKLLALLQQGLHQFLLAHSIRSPTL